MSVEAVAAEHLDVRIAELAARQHGVVSRTQLIRAGAGGEAIQHRLSVGRLHRIHAGVYAVGHPLLGLDGRYLAAVLACGEGAVLSHRSAAALWGLQPTPSGPIDVTIRRGGSRRRAGIAVHTTRSLEAADVTVRRAVPCTSVARTLVDLAAVVTSRALDRALERSLILRVYEGHALEALLDRASGRRGARALRRRLALLADEPVPVRSELERRFLDLIRDARLPAPVVNGLVIGYEVDFHWPAQRLVVETDGSATHDTPYAFERDRRRDLDLEHSGWHVLRIGWRQLINRPGHVRAVLRSRLQ